MPGTLPEFNKVSCRNIIGVLFLLKFNVRSSHHVRPRSTSYQNRKEWDFALLYVRVFRSLDSIVGDESTARKWLTSENLGLNAKPIDLIRNTEGLVRVVQYLDASRGLV